MKTINNLLICLFLLCASGMHAQTINWGTGINASFASDINVGSSVNSFVEFYFYATGSDINNGIVEIVLPYAEEVFDETQVTKLGAVDLGIPSIISDRTLRFPATNIAIGQVVYYRIPRYSKTQYNGIRTGNQNVTVNVYENNSTSADNRIATLPLTYTYNYAKVEIRDPASLPVNQNPNLAMSFGSNNAVDKELSYIPQTFQFELFAYGGAVDSLTITLSFPVGGITLSNWKTGNPGSQTSISLDQIITTNTTTAPYITNCTVKLRKSDFPSGKGIGYEESVPVFVDVAKNNCGNMLVMYASAWAVQNNIKIQTDISNIQGTFSANIGNHPYPEIVSVPDNMKIDEIICQDGSVNEFSCAITNKGQGQARNIMLYCGMRNFGFVDTSTIKIKKGNNGEWEKPQRINIINKYSTGSSINPLYRGIAQSVLIEAPQYLAENNQDTLYICFGGGIPSDFYRYIWKINGSVHRTPFYETQLFSYTNACGETMRANANQYYYLDPSDCYNGFYNFSTANALSFLTNNAVETYTTEMDIAALNSSLLSSDNAKAVCQITLPKGLILETQTDADITVYRKGYPATVWPVKDFTYSLNAAGDSTVYRFTLYKTDKPEALTYGMLSLNLKSTCENDKNETVNGEIRLFIYPTGTVGGGCADVMYDGMQIYPSFTLMCKKEGVTYDYTFRRMTMGWTDDNNDGEPDYGNTPADPEKIQHTFLLMSDTAQFSWEANMLEDGDTTLYAVLFTGLDNDKLAVNPVAKVLTLNENAGLLQDSLVNSRSGNITVPRDGSFVQPNAGYAYIWEISKKDGKPFSMNDKVVFTVEIQCPNNYNTNSTMSTMNSWFYASKTSRIKGASLQARLDSVLIIGDERKGKEAYPFSFNYSAPPIVITDNTGYTNNPSYQFNGITENPITHGVDVGTTRLNQTLAPYEYRHVGTVDSIIIELPEGYVFTENSATCRIAYYLQTGGSSSKDTVLTASDVHVNSFTRKTFVLGSNVFDVNWNGSTKFPLPDGRYFVSIRNLKVSSVPGAPTGTSYATMTVYCDNHTYTQANIPRMAKENALVDYANHSNEAFAFTYIDAGSLRAVSAGNTVQNALSSTVSWMVSLQNTRTSGDACGGWLYVQGPVQNTRLIRQGGAVYTGIGDGGRWIPLPNISPGAPLTDTLVVEYSGTDCNNQTVTVYPIFDPTQTGTGWNPYINGSIEMTDAGFLVAQQTDMSGPKQYIYPKLTLTVQNVESRLSGYIKPLSATPVNPVVPEAGDYTDNEIFINKNFPVEIAFSTFGAQGAVVNTTAQLRVPAGLQYVPDSTYIEINDVNYKVTGSTFIAELQKLDGSADKIITLQLSDAGIAALGSNGQIPGNDTTYLRLKLKPTCDIGFSTPRIGVIFNGERICGASIVTNNREYYSSWLTLGGKSSALNMVMENPTVSVSDFMCNTTAEAVLKFKNQTGPNVSVVISDSLRLVVPKAIDLESGATPVTYNLPAATDYPSGLQGTVSVEAISNRVIGDFRYLTWPMPKTYFDNLASRSEGVQSQNNEYTIQLCFSQPEDYFNGNAHAAVVTAAGLDGCPSISSEFFEKEVPVITRAAYSTWTGNDADWNRSDNWTNGVPGACTDAEISASANVFPVLADTTVRVNSVYFPSGAEIGGIPYLNYDSAKVDLSITSNRWYLLASPFMDMYSGDYILGSTRNNPAVYIRRYQSEDLFSGAAKKVASWTSSFGQTNILLTPGTGYAIWVATDVTEPRTFDFPKDSMSYAVYNKGGTSVAYTEEIPSRANSYRFAFYDKFNQNAGKNNRSFDLAVENGSDVSYTNLLIANPFMSHLDFDAFYSENSGKIGNAFYVWNGNSFTATNQQPAEASEGYNSRYIAPQQSFVVLRSGGADVSTLHFTPEMSVTNIGSSSFRSVTAAQPPRLHLKVYRHNVLQSEAEIRYQPGASNGFEDTSDAWTLFAEDVKKTAVLYSLVDNAAASINTIGSLNEDIALGIRTSEPGELKFEITGAESFGGDVYLIDVAKGGQAIQLETSTEYAFNNTTGDIIDRFYIRILGINTGINDETTAHDILIYQENSVLYVKSDLSDPLRSVELYDAQGRVLVKHAASMQLSQQPSPSSPISLKSSKTLKSQPSRSGTVGAVGMVLGTSCTLPIPGEERMVVVKVVSEKSQLVRKLFIK